MNLVQDHSSGARAVSVRCIVCGAMLYLFLAVIDRDGPSFRAYYHRHCLPDGHPAIHPCPDPYCRICQ